MTNLTSSREWADWRYRAGCRGVDPELFFPVGTGGAAVAQTVAAKAVCARCPVVEPCLSFALVAIPEGVAGGLSAAERRVLWGRRRRVVGVVGRSRPVPVGVDAMVVAALVAGTAVRGASRAELAWAAVRLRGAGRGVGWIAARLGVADKQVRRWVARAQAGQPLTPPTGPRGQGALA